mgnify:CR=1 FL=1
MTGTELLELPAGFTPALLVTALVVAFVASLVLLRQFSLKLTVAVVAVKVGIPLLYFGTLYNARWTLNDDITYTKGGFELVDSSFTLVSVLLTSDGQATLHTLARGQHILYHWWNMLAMKLFATTYYAPVFLNVLVSVVAAFLLVEILRLYSFSERYRTWAGVFFLLHWDVLAWSSLLNLKDTLVLFLTIFALYGVARIAKSGLEPNAHAFVGTLTVLASSTAFWWIRFYVPFFIIAAGVAWLFVHLDGPTKYVIPVVGAIPAAVVFQEGVSAFGYLRPGQFAYGFVRFLLTPRPWGVAESYSFLVIPAMLHWITLVPAAVGALWLCRDSKIARLFVIYAGIVLCFYGLVPELQGPRHRYQISFIFAWAQFHFLWTAAQYVDVRATLSAEKSTPRSTGQSSD